MDELTTAFDTLMAGGLGNIVIFAAWFFVMMKWVLGWDFFG